MNRSEYTSIAATQTPETLSNGRSSPIGYRCCSRICRWIARFPTWHVGLFSPSKTAPARARSRASCLSMMCSAVTSSNSADKQKQHPAFVIALLTPAVLLVHGYHPLADDGAVYVTGIKKLVDPSLYQTDAVFALSPTHLSIFAHVLAALVRWGLVPLPACCWFAIWLRSFSFFSAHGGWRTEYSSLAARAGERCCLLPAASPYRLRARRSPSWIPMSRRVPFPRRSVSSRWQPCSTRNGQSLSCGSVWLRYCIP